MTVLRTTRCLSCPEEHETVEEAALLVGATVSGRYLGVYLLTVYDEKVCCVWEGGGSD